MSLLENVNTNGLSILKNPFTQDKVQAVRLVMHRHLFDGEPRYYATVEFKNGDTKGEQNIDATSFNDLIQKTESFLKTLDKNAKL